MTRPDLSLSSTETAMFRSACETILAANQALYLTGTIAGTQGHCLTPLPRVTVRLFDGFWTQTALEPDHVKAELELVSAILRPLLVALARSWPRAWVPPRLGIMTDGSGMIFCPVLPSPEEERWPQRLLSSRSCTVELLPFAVGSSWSMVNNSRGDAYH